MIPKKSDVVKQRKEKEEQRFEEQKDIYLNQISHELLNTNKKILGPFSGKDKMRKAIKKALVDAGWEVSIKTKIETCKKGDKEYKYHNRFMVNIK